MLTIAFIAMENAFVVDHGVDGLFFDEERRHDGDGRLIGARGARHLSDYGRVL